MKYPEEEACREAAAFRCRGRANRQIYSRIYPKRGMAAVPVFSYNNPRFFGDLEARKDDRFWGRKEEGNMRMHMRSFASIALAVIGWSAVLGAPTGALAAIVTVPGGLGPGDQYRLAFVTSTIQTASSTDIAVYNAFVTTAVNNQGGALAALGTTWTAIGSTSTVDARDNTGTNPSSTGVPIYRLDGTKIADNNADLWDGAIASPINTFEDGTTASFDTFVNTGSNNDGTPFDASSALGGGAPIIGIISLTGSWITQGSGSIGANRPYYAISDPLTVIPLPAALPLFLTALAGLIFVGRRRRKEAHA